MPCRPLRKPAFFLRIAAVLKSARQTKSYAEGEGNIHSDRGREMLQCLREKCSTLRVVGSFEKEIVLRGDEE